MDARLARFLEKHAVSEREAVEADVAPYRGVPPGDCWEDIRMLSRVAVEMVAMQPDAHALMAEREPPHPSYRALIRRLRRAP